MSAVKTPHMCLLLAGIELFRGIREPRWFLICKQTKAEVILLAVFWRLMTPHWKFLLQPKTFFFSFQTFRNRPASRQRSRCTLNMTSEEFSPKVVVIIWKKIQYEKREYRNIQHKKTVREFQFPFFFFLIENRNRILKKKSLTIIRNIININQ